MHALQQCSVSTSRVAPSGLCRAASLSFGVSVKHGNAIIVQELAGILKLEVGNGLKESLHRLLWS